jgi:methyl-accepting chemotaxis protein
MIRSLNIAKRSVIAFGLIGGLTLLLGLMTILQLRSLDSILVELVDRDMPVTAEIGEMRGEFLAIVVETYRLARAGSPQEVQQIENDIKVLIDYLRAESREAMAALRSNESKAVLNRGDQAAERYYQQLQQLSKAVNADDASQEQLTLQQLEQIRKELKDIYSDLEDAVKVDSVQVTGQAKALSTQVQLAMWIGLVVVLALSTLFAWLYTRSVVAPMHHAMRFSQRIANKDLSREMIVEGMDEPSVMLQSLNRMQQSLKGTLIQIVQASEQLARTSAELSTKEHSTKTMHDQSSELSKAAMAVNQLTSAIEQVAINASQTTKESAAAGVASQTGQSKVRETMSTLKVLVTGVEQSLQGVQSLATQVTNIGSLLDVIRAIAEQKNLLALNAAIEAARAGESGRGFAVVADEVRALAHRTQQSTKEIESMINSVQEETNSTVQAISQNNAHVLATMRSAEQTEQAIQEVNSVIEKINQQNAAIASAVEHQSVVLKEVDMNLSTINQLSLNAVKASNESALSSVAVNQIANDLNKLVIEFKV